MPVASYTKLPVTIEAIQYTGDNLKEVLEFTGKHEEFDTWFLSFEDYEAYVKQDEMAFKIKTLEGTMKAFPSDYIIKGINGEYYPCKENIFLQTYVLVVDNEGDCSL